MQKQLNDAIGERDEARTSLASLHNKLYGEGGTEHNPKPGSVQKQLNDANDAIILKNRQIDLMSAGGKLRDATWFAKFDKIVSAAQGIGAGLATVFLGDGLILDAVGGKTEAEIKAEMSHIPTARVHVAAIEGATVEEIKYGIENGWLPEKTAYTVIHAGRAEIEANENALINGNQNLSESIGQKIGGIYTVLIAKTQNQSGNATSVIFSGIIPPSGSSVHSSNINQINGNNGIKSGELGALIDDTTNDYVKMIAPPAIAGFIAQTNARLNNQPTYVASAMLKPNNTFLANKKMDYKYHMAMANTRAKVAFGNQWERRECQARFFRINFYRVNSA